MITPKPILKTLLVKGNQSLHLTYYPAEKCGVILRWWLDHKPHDSNPGIVLGGSEEIRAAHQGLTEVLQHMDSQQSSELIHQQFKKNHCYRLMLSRSKQGFFEVYTLERWAQHREQKSWTKGEEFSLKTEEELARVLTALTSLWADYLKAERISFQHGVQGEDRLLMGDHDRTGQQIRFVTDTNPGVCSLIRRWGNAGDWKIEQGIDLNSPEQLCLVVAALTKCWHRMRENRLTGPCIDFATAVQRLRHGHCVTRQEWHANGCYLYYREEDATTPIYIHRPVTGDSYWVPTQTEILGTDWYDLGPDPEKTREVDPA